MKNSGHCSKLRDATACFKTPTNGTQNVALRHAAACCYRWCLDTSLLANLGIPLGCACDIRSILREEPSLGSDRSGLDLSLAPVFAPHSQRGCNPALGSFGVVQGYTALGGSLTAADTGYFTDSEEMADEKDNDAGGNKLGLGTDPRGHERKHVRRAPNGSRGWMSVSAIRSRGHSPMHGGNTGWNDGKFFENSESAEDSAHRD